MQLTLLKLRIRSLVKNKNVSAGAVIALMAITLGVLVIFNPVARAVLPAPGGVEGAALWLKADGAGLVVNGSNQVEHWDDQSGSGIVTTEAQASFPGHTTSITASNSILRVANGVNFNPAVDFAGTFDRTLRGSASASWNSTADLTMFGVSSTEGSTPGSLSGIFNTNGGWSSNATVGRGLITSKPGNGFLLDGAGCSPGITSLTSQPHIGRGVYVATNTTAGGSIWVDGKKEVDTGGCAQGTGGANFEIGGRTSGPATYDNRVFNGKIPEVIVYKSALTDAQAQRVDSYLAIKYGLTLNPAAGLDYLASDGTTKAWDVAANAGYHNNVFGIGRDDNSALNQKQSKSQNSQGIVTVGHGTIETTNQDNSNNFGTDKTFLMFGDDNNSATTWTNTGATGTPLANYQRLPRTWKVQETGTVGNVTIALDTADTDANVPSAISNYYLLRDSDNDSSFADETPILMTDNGADQFSVSGINFANGELFTFATLANAYSVEIQVVDNLTGEDGNTGTFKVRLGARPSAPVTVALTSSNINEGTVPASITIQPDDWDNFDVNVVTVNGINDSPPVGDGAVTYDIVTGDVTSTDTNFDVLDGSDVDDVAMSNQNDDPPGIVAAVIDGFSGENGDTVRVRFELLSASSADVIIPLSLSDSSEGSLGAATSITITPANWNQSQNNEIVITGVDDSLTDGDILYQLITGDPTSGDAGYDALTATGIADMSLTNTDNDSPGVTVSQTDNSTDVTEGGATDTFTVVLNTQPAPGNAVVINMQPDGQIDVGSDAGAAIQLTFDSSNWDQPQVVTVTANDDSAIEGDHTGAISIGIDDTTTEADYSSLNPADVTVQVTDNDDDNDGIAAVVEDTCPNGGDSNDDGTRDSLQLHVTCFPSPVTGEYVGLEIDSSCQLNTEGVATETDQIADDPAYEYPYGLMNFEADCGAPGYTATVQQYYYGVTSDSHILRKHNPDTGAYFNVEGAVLDQLTIGGEVLAKATFQIEDGGELDMDGMANGTIIDPAGLGLQAEPDSGLAPTGQNLLLYNLLGAIVIIVSIVAIFRYKTVRV